MKMCRYCKNPVYTPKEQENITWYKRGEGWYYHLSCWQDYQKTKDERPDHEWLDLIFDILKRELHSSYNYHMVKRQVDKMIANGKTMKGIFYTVNYAFLIKGIVYKPEFGLGIIPYLYEESTEYWGNRWTKEKDIFETIERLQIERNTEKKILKMKETKREITPEPEI